MPFQAFYLHILSGQVEGLIDLRLESAILDLVVFLLPTCLCNLSLLFFQLSLQLLRKLFLVIRRINRLNVAIRVDLRFKTVVSLLIKLMLPQQLLSLGQLLCCLVDYGDRRRYYR